MFLIFITSIKASFPFPLNFRFACCIDQKEELSGNYPYFQKNGNLSLCLENYALFSLPPIFTNNLYTYTLSYTIYLREPSDNSNFKLRWQVYTHIHA